MKISSKLAAFTMVLLSTVLVACERSNTVCTQDDGTTKIPIHLVDLIASTPEPRSTNIPVMVKINGKMVEVDKLVDYPLCNDDWSGVVYVGCDAKIAEAEIDEEDYPLFFRGCGLNIQPGTVVYVAAHNDAAFYKGCSCHTGENPVEQNKPIP